MQNPQEEEKKDSVNTEPESDTKEESQAPKEHDDHESEGKKKKKHPDIEKLHSENEELKAELDKVKDSLLRLSAEFDNYKKRTTRERENLYNESVAATIALLLPVLDNLERAVSVEGEGESLKKGIEMTLGQFSEALKKLGVSEIDVNIGDMVDPNFHNAMMQVEHDTLPSGAIAEVFIKGYKLGDKVIRHTLVKSAN